MGAPGAGAPPPPYFSDSYVAARLNFIHTDHTALAYRSKEPPLPNHLPTPLHTFRLVNLSLAIML